MMMMILTSLLNPQLADCARESGHPDRKKFEAIFKQCRPLREPSFGNLSTACTGCQPLLMSHNKSLCSVEADFEKLKTKQRKVMLLDIPAVYDAEANERHEPTLEKQEMAEEAICTGYAFPTNHYLVTDNLWQAFREAQGQKSSRMMMMILTSWLNPQLADCARESGHPDRKKFEAIFNQCRPLISSPNMEDILIHLLRDKEDNDVAQQISKILESSAVR
ncbi:hypothetical protein ACROYT_G015932 [Oculina patagonica]